MSGIPILNITEFDRNRDMFVAEFGAAYREWGFAGIQGHDIDIAVIQDAFQAAEAFFTLPLSAKQRYCQADNAFFRGYVPFGTEKAKDSPHADLKEFFHVGRESGVDNQPAPHLFPNVWPDEVPEFRRAFTSIYSALDKLALQILQAVALYLQLPADYFDTKVQNGEALLRILHYPPIEDETIPNLRAAAHEDINLITLLAGSEQDGLEVLSRSGEWVPISMIEGTIICNVGDMLQRLTNHRLPSTTHRVANPQGEQARVSRYSIPFFVHPDPEVSLACLPQCVDEDHPQRYPDISAGDYLQERLQEIGLAK
ncbi:MAG: 2-oxoglutarate and iron-dependent oxygenase domain-containing protein [Pseudomonadota bacterium]